MSQFFNRALETNPYDWEALRKNAPTQPSLFASALNKQNDELAKYMSTPKKLRSEEINAAFFAAHVSDNTQGINLLFPYASSAGIEAGKLCLIGSTYINDLTLFNETALWLKKHGENALKKKDLRNHCLINFSAFNHVDKVQELLKTSKSTLKNDSAVRHFCLSIAHPAAHYGSQELLELSLPIAEEYFGRKNGYFQHLLCSTLFILLSTYKTPNGGEQTLSADAHTQAFEWLLNHYEADCFTNILYQSNSYPLDNGRLIELLKKFDETTLRANMEKISRSTHLSVISHAYEQLCNLRQKEVLNSHITTSSVSTTARKM